MPPFNTCLIFLLFDFLCLVKNWLLFRSDTELSIRGQDPQSEGRKSAWITADNMDCYRRKTDKKQSVILYYAIVNTNKFVKIIAVILSHLSLQTSKVYPSTTLLPSGRILKSQHKMFFQVIHKRSRHTI